jgi:hypothetical protein
MKIFQGALAVLIAISAAAGPSAADERNHRRGAERERHEAWRGDIHRFHEYDLGLWRGGRWYRGRHEGRYGWWWITGGYWYLYPAPVYPYPDPYLPPGAIAPMTVPGGAQHWYYCASPKGYYPYVAQCGTAWQAVPAYPQAGTAPLPAPSAPYPTAPAPMAAPPSQQSWYYCSNPQGYYPTVPECRSGWQQVPANAPPGVAR